MTERAAAGPDDNVNTLINIATCYTHMPAKKEKVACIISKIKGDYPECDWVKRLETVEGAVERVKMQYSA